MPKREQAGSVPESDEPTGQGDTLAVAKIPRPAEWYDPDWEEVRLHEVEPDQPVWVKATTIGEGYDPTTATVDQTHDRRLWVGGMTVAPEYARVLQDLMVWRRRR